MPETPNTSGPRSIELAVSGTTARATLWWHFAPKMLSALVQSLPLELPLQHCKWSGRACFSEIDSGPICEVEGLETPVTSLYPRVLAVKPATARAPRAELLIAYGDAEFRWPDGRRYVTPIAELEPGADAFLEGLGRTATDGETRIRLSVGEAI
jgi:hypothetical protein